MWETTRAWIDTPPGTPVDPDAPTADELAALAAFRAGRTGVIDGV